MRFIIISMIFGLLLYADEIDRVESVLKDIENLRESNIECQNKLDSKDNSKEVDKYRRLLFLEKQKNNLYAEKIKILDKSTSIIEKNDKSNNKEIKILLSKENEYKKIIKKYQEKIENKDEIIKSLKNQINSSKKENRYIENNPSSKLVMKENVEIIESFKASPFRLISDSDIYDSINGNVVYNWDAKTSFTSSVMTQNWVKITGYFVNREWQKADEELWVEKINTIKRLKGTFN